MKLLLDPFHHLRWKSFVRAFGGKSSDLDYRINVSVDLGFIYVETPKVTCTTIKATLKSALGLPIAPDDIAAIHDMRDARIAKPRDNLPAFFRLLRTPSAFRFTFVRNPYTRVLSAYLDKIAAKGAGAIHRSEQLVARAERERVERRRELMLPQSGEVSFRRFVDVLLTTDPAKMDSHWKPLHLLTRPDLIRYDHIGRFENLDADMDAVLARLSLDAANYRRHQDHRTDAAARLRRHYDRETEAMVREIYARDFELFGYDTAFPA